MSMTFDPPAPGRRLHAHAFRAMNCAMGAWVVTRNARAAHCALQAVEALMHGTEALLSRFRPHSELNRLNARPGQARRVSPPLADVLSAALAAARQTGGLYDPTILDSLENAGYDRSFEGVRDEAQPPLLCRRGRPAGRTSVSTGPCAASSCHRACASTSVGSPKVGSLIGRAPVSPCRTMPCRRGGRSCRPRASRGLTRLAGWCG